MTVNMHIRSFRETRESSWRELESLIAGRKPFGSPEEFERFIRLYRRAVRDLAQARIRFPEDPVTPYLNALVSAAHNRLYRSERGTLARFVGFFTHGFPQRFRRLSVYIAIAAAVTLAAGAFGYVVTWVSPLDAYTLLPPTLSTHVEPGQAGPHAVDAPLMSSLIMTNNIGVALRAFAGGITAGLFTLYALWQNGIILGVLAAMFQHSARAVVFWSLIVPHGVTELLAIFIAGGAGLRFAHALVAPGPWRRGQALRLALADSVQLMLGTVPMFILAGIIEGFVTPAALPVWLKFAIAAVSGVWWCVYFGWVGRTRKLTVRTQTAADAPDILARRW